MIMTNHRDPYPEPYEAPHEIGRYTDADCNTVIKVRASNAQDAASLRDGMTVAGDGYKATVKTGHRQYELRTEPTRYEVDHRPSESRAAYRQRMYKENSR